MHGFDLVSYFHLSIVVALKLCAPVLIAPLIAGLGTSLFQAVTQISDATLSFLPKLCAMLAAAYYAGPFLSRTLADYMHASLGNLVLIGGQ